MIKQISDVVSNVYKIYDDAKIQNYYPYLIKLVSVYVFLVCIHLSLIFILCCIYFSIQAYMSFI